jgi:hypothetical protein
MLVVLLCLSDDSYRHVRGTTGINRENAPVCIPHLLHYCVALWRMHADDVIHIFHIPKLPAGNIKASGIGLLQGGFYTVIESVPGTGEW